MVKAFCRSPVWYVRVPSTWRNGCHTFSHCWSWSIKFVQLHTGDGLTGDQNDTNWVSVGIGWGIGGSCLFSFKNTQKQVSSMHEQCERHAKGTPKRKTVKPYLKLIASFHLNMDYRVSVLGSPLSVMQVSWPASKFKATSYYSVHPVILSATHMSK